MSQNNNDNSSFSYLAQQVRKTILTISYEKKTPHIGSALSCVELLLASYGMWNKNQITGNARNSVILSKGHAATALYSVLNMKGMITDKLITKYADPWSPLPEHPVLNEELGIQATTGSLGHGLSIGTGLALGFRINNVKKNMFVIMSDGECNEGSVWEAAIFAPSQNLDNLTVVIDANKWQATDRSTNIISNQALSGIFKSFGWASVNVDGHDEHDLSDVFSKLPLERGKPSAVIGHTVKGKGISFMEDDNNWHYRVPTLEELNKAKLELGMK